MEVVHARLLWNRRASGASLAVSVAIEENGKSKKSCRVGPRRRSFYD